jgi:hypothetical protein
MIPSRNRQRIVGHKQTFEPRLLNECFDSSNVSVALGADQCLRWVRGRHRSNQGAMLVRLLSGRRGSSGGDPV